ncbi:hypothetical protein AcW1_005229 [Taiwanofungus camphoratus]|nr:hypothetical protein AcW2_003999 [Antrodia cinnamomea]KAI0927805.1 hypothetical protein AcW2_003999 [Antrodia cinnamomea]KAI0948808.1 hypothetical protein AcV7_009453 [Antrodia cinnamomea]KAI0956588.1 hypothetical protein AcW1_005229 [Antrodia cinnamomea]
MHYEPSQLTIHTQRLQRSASCTVTDPLVVTTNAPRSTSTGRMKRQSRFLSLTGCNTKKALPTVSITNTSVPRAVTACLLPSPSGLPDAPAHSFIPFPSSPIPCPSPRNDNPGIDLISESQNVGGDDTLATVGTSHTAAWQNVRRGYSRSCLASSYLYRDSLARYGEKPSNHKSGPSNARCAPKHATPHKVSHHVDRSETKSLDATGRRLGMSAGTPNPRRARKGKRLAADVQFLAVVHRSIAWWARKHAAQEETKDVCIEQDVLLAKRLWKTLVDQGCKPVPFEAGPGIPTPAPFPATCTSASFPACTQETGLPTPTLTPPGESVTATSVAPSPSANTSSPLSRDILTTSQLVASLTLRYRDRCTIRHRSPSSASKDNRAKSIASRITWMQTLTQRPRSNLSQVAFTALDLLDVPSG